MTLYDLQKIVDNISVPMERLALDQLKRHPEDCKCKGCEGARKILKYSLR